MTKKSDDVESGQADSTGGAGQATSGDQAGDKQTSRSNEELSPAVVDLINDTVKRAVQSTKDRGIAKNAREIQHLSEQFKRFEQYRSQGMTPEQAERQMVIDDMVAERLGGGDTSEGGDSQARESNSKEASTTVEFESIVKAMGLNPDDEDVLQIIADKEPLDAVQEIAKLTASKGEKKEVIGSAVSAEVRGSGEDANPIGNVTDPSDLFKIARKDGKV